VNLSGGPGKNLGEEWDEMMEHLNRLAKDRKFLSPPRSNHRLAPHACWGKPNSTRPLKQKGDKERKLSPEQRSLFLFPL